MFKKWTIAFGFLILMITAIVWAAPVPDTGQIKCYNNNSEIDCPSPGEPFYGQDANYTINPMSYTKLDGSGNALPDSATSWVMVRDNVTGLIWEVKSGTDGVKNYNDPHDADNTYTWYNSNPATNGGNAGTPGNGTDTEDFINALNNANYGGYSDWRLPTIKELTDIDNYGIPSPGPTINTEYFPNTVSSHYWSSITFYENKGVAWDLNFTSSYQSAFKKDRDNYVRAVRGGQSQSSYVDNGNGTVTDTSTGLMWQQVGYSSTKYWEQDLANCEGLSLGGYTDWRLPTIKEIMSLVDFNKGSPSINTTYFPNTDTINSYFPSTSDASNAILIWGMSFKGGHYDNYGKASSGRHNVRAVRGGNLVVPTPPILSVSPAIQNVTKDTGSTVFNVSNTGTGTMNWSAAVSSGGDWLSITSGASGSNFGTINCSYSANTTTSSRTATIRITASSGTTGSPVDVTVTQAPAPVITTECTANTAFIDGNFFLHIPYLSYVDQMSNTTTFWADFVYEFIPEYPNLIFFKLANAGIIANPSFSCVASTLYSDLSIHIPDVLLPDETTHLWLDLVYGNSYFLIPYYVFN